MDELTGRPESAEERLADIKEQDLVDAIKGLAGQDETYLSQIKVEEVVLDVEWLIKQAEKAERYEKVLKQVAYGEITGWSGSDVLGKVTDLAIEILKG